MDRNTIIGFVLIAAIFITWGVITKPSEEELAEARRVSDSVAQVRQKEALEKQISDALVREQGGAKLSEIDSLRNVVKKLDLGLFGAVAEGKKEIYSLENNLVKFEVSTQGGRPYAAELVNYTTYDGRPIRIFDGDSTIFGLNFYFNNRPVNTNDLFFSAASHDKVIKVTDEPGELRMRMQVDSSKYIEYRYTLLPNSYQVNLDMQIVGLQELKSNNPRAIDLLWEYYSPRQEKGWKNESYYTTIFYKPYEEDPNFFNGRAKKEIQEEDISTQVEWVAFKDQFFSSVLMAQKSFDNAYVKMETMPEEGDYIRLFKSKIGLTYNHNYDETLNLQFYLGPNKFKYLKENYGDRQLEDLVNVGRSIIKWINQFVIINIFEWLNKSIANYGIIILLLTLIIKLALLPLTFKSYVSQAKMRVLKPLVDEATAKIPQDKQMERQQATMAIYRKAGVSPMGGCLPMVLQMPILFAMFRFFPTSIELRQQSFLWATDLSTYDAIFEWQATIPLISNFYGNHVSLFTILMTVTTILSMKMNGSATGGQQMPGMKGMMYIMPVMFMFMLNNFSAGLTYYYFLANLITLGQNYLFKFVIDEEALLAKMKSKQAKPKKKSNFQKRLEDMAKQRSAYPRAKKR